MTLAKRPRKALGRAGTASEEKPTASGTPIPIGALEQHVAIVGRTGSGKSYTARGAVEGLLDAGRQVVVLDPTGVWWGSAPAPTAGPAFRFR